MSTEQQQLEAGIRALEAQRGLLGDAMLELARSKLAAQVRLDCVVGQTRANAAPVTMAKLPSAINCHWTKSLAAGDDGRYFYVGIGSNSNIGERGTALERGANCRPKVIFVPFVRSPQRPAGRLRHRFPGRWQDHGPPGRRDGRPQGRIDRG